ncbi:universal stress protein [Hyphomicrobium sp.]|uniref:universal stress protein n=1 Tax=Hyphomicrobium sp. TaxID=82 RepID=UPI003FA5CAE1
MQGVEQGMALAKALNSKVTVIMVALPYPLMHPAPGETWRKSQHDAAEAAFKTIKDMAKASGIEVSTITSVNESPADAIVEAAEQQGCDLIMMSSHGRRGVRRLLLGSQTAAVVSHSPVSVVIVR